jgi:hypothetical protein
VFAPRADDAHVLLVDVDRGILFWGLAQDDVERPLTRMRKYSLVASGARKVGREAKPPLKLGAYPEHGGDPDSIQFFQMAGLDYLSCSPYRVPIARVAASRIFPGLSAFLGAAVVRSWFQLERPKWNHGDPDSAWRAA